MHNIKPLIALHRKDNAMIVIKGYPFGEFSHRRVDLEAAISNKFNYFSTLLLGGENVISFDEYILLNDFILSQYQDVIIIENNLYYNFYPLGISIEQRDIEGLRVHYDSEMNEVAQENENLQPYQDIYANVIRTSQQYYVAYNQMIRSEKEQVIKVHPYQFNEMILSEYKEGIETLDIIEELDYLELLERVVSDRIHRFQIVKSNLGIDSQELLDRMVILQNNYPQIDFRFVKKVREAAERFIHPELRRILTEFWKHDEFREISIYNLEALDDGKKELETIKQSDVISHLVEQVERCRDNESFRDVFVTAPTGSGKSAMFQIPAIYLARKYGLFTLVISPLIGLMQDQVQSMGGMGYQHSRTINSDISPIKKQEILEDIAEGKCHLLYISPESLMSKSDLVQIIGSRKLGMLVIDEAHIVTTWGKQFRPDYWYLGDHILRLRKSQLKRENMQFVIATFTATAIYGGLENMYQETIQSLHMIDPITYLGYVKRDDIDIHVEKAELITGRSEYELNKFDQLLKRIKKSIAFNQKTLIYFPTVALIERFHDYCKYNSVEKYVAKYHGRLQGFKKEENYLQFRSGEKTIMVATKAFGMGIDISDIEVVTHFAPTGNVCDYIQEIGRVARDPKLHGLADYHYMSNDFKHINRLHGLSTIKEYQLIEVIKKVYQLHNENIRHKKKRFTKKRNEMLVDAESFSHIFENPFFNEDDGINKVKTAMLLIQKDFERTMSFSPFSVRPIPLFEIGFFKIPLEKLKQLNRRYGNSVTVIDQEKEICNVNLKTIWEKAFDAKYSFPKFKYMIYSKDPDLNFDYKTDLDPVLRVEVTSVQDHRTVFNHMQDAIKTVINANVRANKFIALEDMIQEVSITARISHHQARSIVDITIAAMKIYSKEFSKSFYSNMFKSRNLMMGNVKYSFTTATTAYFKWLRKGLDFIDANTVDGELYLIQNGNSKLFKEYILLLGIFESYEILTFKALGGRNSQLYIYVNQTKTMKEIINRPGYYKNKLLELVGQRHILSVQMLTYLFESDFDNDKTWDVIEDYFLGQIPDPVKRAYEEKTGSSLQVYN